MGLIDKLLGRDEPAQEARAPRHTAPEGRAVDPDEAAVERYRYMLRTAPPDTIEEAHAEAFAKLTPEQRRQVLAELSAAVPAGERAASDDPRSLARMATRAELREPGTMERALGGRGGGMGGPGMGMGSMFAGTLLAGVAGSFIGSSIAHSFFNDGGNDAYADGYQDGAEAPSDTGGDMGGDTGGDVGGDLGGDMGGGDFGF
jgi:hypothetical protein